MCGLVKTATPFLIMAVITWGCGHHNPCENAKWTPECHKDNECNTSDACWCGKCIPQECTGIIPFPVGAVKDAVLLKTGKGTSDNYGNVSNQSAKLYYEDVMDVENMEVCLTYFYVDTGRVPHHVFDYNGIQCLTELNDLKICYLDTHDLSPLSKLKKLSTFTIQKPFLKLTINDFGPLSSTSLTDLDLSMGSGIVDTVSDISVLAGFTSLVNLNLSGNNITAIDSLATLVNLTNLDLTSNQVIDITPLVDNPGLGTGDKIILVGNPIDCSQQGANIQALCQRGVNVVTFCPGCQ